MYFDITEEVYMAKNGVVEERLHNIEQFKEAGVQAGSPSE
jgi:hypothetical protein